MDCAFPPHPESKCGLHPPHLSLGGDPGSGYGSEAHHQANTLQPLNHVQPLQARTACAVQQPNENGGHSAKVDGTPDLLHLVVEVKGYRGGDAKEKKSTMDTYWIPGVSNLGSHGWWAFSEFGDVYEMESDFAAKVEREFDRILAIAMQGSGPAASSPH